MFKASTRNPLTLPSVWLKRKVMVFPPAWTTPAGRFMVILKVANPPPIPPYAAAFPKSVTLLVLIGSQAELFTCTLACVSKRTPWIAIHRTNWPVRFEPLGMFTQADTVVPFGPITSSGSVTVGGGPVLGVRVTVAVPVLVVSTTLVAITVTICGLPIVEGAVYTPFTMLPTAGLNDQVTAVLLVPLTKAVKVVLWPAPSDAEAGPTFTDTGCNDTV